MIRTVVHLQRFFSRISGDWVTVTSTSTSECSEREGEKRIRIVLGAALLMTGVGLVATTGVANAATLAYDINGSWTVNGPEAPRLTSSGGSISIDMSYAGRPAATSKSCRTVSSDGSSRTRLGGRTTGRRFVRSG